VRAMDDVRLTMMLESADCLSNTDPCPQVRDVVVVPAPILS